MCRIVIAVFALIACVPLSAQEKHPFTFEDMMKLKRVEEPVPSPDGKWVLFAAVDVDLAANTKTPHIWIVPLSGTAGPSTSQNASPAANHPAPVGMTGERVLIGDQDADRPRWAPDGKRFAFISTKEGGSQVWIADFDGVTGAVTDKYKFTSIATEASGELWSPDGARILFTSDVYPECDGAPVPEAECNANKLKDVAEAKVKAQIFTNLLYRHWNTYKEGKRTHLFVTTFCLTTPSRADLPKAPSDTSGNKRSPLGRLVEPGCANAPRDLTPGDFDAPPFSTGGQDNYAFSPDGQEICFTSNHDKVEATSTNNDLWIVPVNEGTMGIPPARAKNITADNLASDSTPLYSRDGKYIAYRAQQRPGYESDRFRLMLYDRKTGHRQSLTEDFDGWIGTFTWTPDSKSVYFSSEFKGEAPIYNLSIAGGKPDFVIGGLLDNLAVTPDGSTIVFTRMSVSAPNEIYTEGLHFRFSAHPNPLTHLNDALLSEISMSPLEPFWFTGANSDQVQGFLVRPPNFDQNKKYPLKFIIHGGPQVPMGDQWSYRWNHELFAANGYVVIFINFHGSPGYGQKFIDAINGDWGGAPFEDLMKGLDYAEQHYPFIDKDRECALGASYGGWMINWILGHTDRFKCLVSHDSQFNTTSAWGSTEELWFPEWEFKGTPYTNRSMYDKWSPHLYADKFKTPTLVIHGQKDYRLDVSEGFQLFTTLQRQGVPSKMLYFPDEGHWVLKPQNSQLWYKTVNDWVDQWLKK